MIEKPKPKFSRMMVIIYALLAGGVISLGAYLGVEVGFHPAWVMAAIFGLLGGFAFVFHWIGEGRIWKQIAMGEWALMLLTATIYILVESDAHPAIAFASVMFLTAGILLLFRHSRHVKVSQGSEHHQIEWQKLGSGGEKLDPLKSSDRDRAEVAHRR